MYQTDTRKRRRLFGVSPEQAGALVKYGSSAVSRAGRAVLPWIASAAAATGAAYSASRTKKGAIESSVNSYQHDSRTRYRYRRQPRRKRRAYVRKVRLFDHLMSKRQPLQTYTVKKTQSGTSAVDNQISFGVLLYSTQIGGSENDLQQMFYDAYAVASLANIDQKKLIIKSGVLDVQLTNNGSQGMVIDVYRIRCRNVWNANDSMYTMWNTTFNDQTAITSKSASDPAVTPFQNPSFCKYYKVLDKREILLSAGNTTTFQLRMPRNVWVSGRRVANEPQALRGVAQGFLFQARGMPVQNAGPVYQLAATNIVWSYQKTYNYALPVGAEASEQIHDA